MRFSVRTLVVTLLLSVPCAGSTETSGPIRVLVLLGGNYHPYEAGSRLLVEAAARSYPIEATFVRLDHPPFGQPENESATITSNPAVLEDPQLGRKYDVLFAYHQDTWMELTPAQLAGYFGFVRSGGGLVAIHSSSQPLMKNPEFVRMLGAQFARHEPYRLMTVERAAGQGDSPLLDGVAERFQTQDEFYYVEEAENVEKQILLTAKAEDGAARPIAWTKAYDKGRVFCTVLGHDLRSHQNTSFQWLVRNALVWAAGRTDDARFVPLFNSKDLADWTVMEQSGFRIEDGAMRSYGGMGLLWYSKKKFRDFALLIEYKVNQQAANSGVFLRIPDPPKSFWDAVNHGYEVQICDTGAPKRNTGAVFDFQAPTHVPSRPPGEWNLLEISVVNQRYTVVLNGEKVNDFIGERALEGYIGVQNHDDESIVLIRRIEIKELP